MIKKQPESLKNVTQRWECTICLGYSANTENSAETTSTVHDWLHEAGIARERIRHAPGNAWIELNATVQEAEDLLKTKYHMFEHDTGTKHVACEEYSLPSHVRHHVDFVLPSVHFDSKLKRSTDTDAAPLDKRATRHRPTPGTGDSVGKKKTSGGGPVAPKKGAVLNRFNQLIGQLEHCDTFIVPNCLRALYEFPPGITKNPKNSYGIVEYSPEAYVPSDLDLFFRNFSTRQVGNRPTLDSIDGGVNQQQQMSFGLNGESDLDLEYGRSY